MCHKRGYKSPFKSGISSFNVKTDKDLFHFPGNSILKYTLVFLFYFISFAAKAQSEDEILLTFRHPAVGHIYVNALYNENLNQGYLPVLELFNLFGIYTNPDITNFSVKGTYLKNDLPFSIDLKNQLIKLGEKEFHLKAEEFRIGSTDYFLSPAIFEKVFELNFTIDILPLTLTMETQYIMPVQERKKREAIRNKVNENNKENKEFPLLYKHKKHFIGGAMLDYNFSGDYSKEIYNINYSTTLGIELFGGDMQTSILGIKSSLKENQLRLGSLKWRYAIVNSPFISNVTIGKISTKGLLGKSIKGISISNEPIEPLKTFNTYVIDGNTEANSEVELYENERLIEFKRSDELGYYRFDIPLNYGASRLSIHIFTNTGQTIILDRQIEVPYSFIPKGKIQYQVQSGVANGEEELYGSKAIISHGQAGYGLTNWLSTEIGSDIVTDALVKEDPFLYGSLNARVAGQYLFKADIAPQAYCKFAGSVAYSNNTSFQVAYTRFTGISNFNLRGITDQFGISAFLPIHLFGGNFGVRVGGDHVILPNSSITNYQVNLSSRIGPINARLNYTDFFNKTPEATKFGRASLTSVFTYVIKRTPGIPIYLRGMFIRSQTSYIVRDQKMEKTEIQFSRSTTKGGRINLNFDYNFIQKSFSAQVGLVLDLKTIRSTTNIQSNGKEHSIRQTVSGSVGYDQNFKKLRLNNREQVGRASASILLYVDLNNSGKYDRGDEILPYRAVKLDQSSKMKVDKDGILRVNQLQAYHKYKLSINRAAIPNATLVPIINELSFVADPNQYKKIEIPFYRGGTIGGTIYLRKNKIDEGQGGLKLIVKDVNTDYTQTIRTFSDGGFFLMDLPPGEYTLEIDPAQLRFLNATEETKALEFEIKALADGDFIENLDMTIFVKNKEEK